ncbi:hypothetical protein NQ317_018737 [Molorchus minor]|uniref:Uncharacterized protein n=1 Tax=Molorchus minor TaxID=1323400 RepID=A0ABQ9IQY1_9CUCU|nr:hypothetical protein NQ317_018737 [Molorchus minor]
MYVPCSDQVSPSARDIIPLDLMTPVTLLIIELLPHGYFPIVTNNRPTYTKRRYIPSSMNASSSACP